MSYTDTDGYVRQHLPSVATTDRMSNERRLDAFPHLLTACQRVLRYGDLLPELADEARAAIARAEGRK